MSARTAKRCSERDPVWSRQCEKPAAHEGVHRNEEPGDNLTWGTVAQIREYEGLTTTETKPSGDE